MSMLSVISYSKTPNHNGEWPVFGAVFLLSEDIRRKTEHCAWESKEGISYTKVPIYLTAVELTVTLPPLSLEFMQQVHKAQADKKIHFSGKTYFGASFHMFAVVQLDPGVPAMTVQRQAVPLVQQYRLFGPNYSNTRTTIEPEKKKHSGHKPFREVWRTRDLRVSNGLPEVSGFPSKRPRSLSLWYRSFATTVSQLKMCDFSGQTFKGFEVL